MTVRQVAVIMVHSSLVARTMRGRRGGVKKIVNERSLTESSTTDLRLPSAGTAGTTSQVVILPPLSPRATLAAADSSA